MIWKILVAVILGILCVSQGVGLIRDLKKRRNKSVINKDNLKGDNTNK